MNDNISQVLDKIADKLGATGAHLFEVMARQALISGIVWSVIQAMLVVVVPIIIVKLGRMTARKWSDICHNDNEVIVLLAWVFGGTVALVIFLVSVFTLPESIMSVVNPEYYAIKDVLEALK